MRPPVAVERVSPLSGGEQTSPAPVPLSGAAKARNRKLETGTRLHNEAWSAGAAAPSIICARRSPHRNFSSHLASGFFKPSF
ncbi:unnamed protein product, partial [Staurois parvus]